MTNDHGVGLLGNLGNDSQRRRLIGFNFASQINLKINAFTSAVHSYLDAVIFVQRTESMF